MRPVAVKLYQAMRRAHQELTELRVELERDVRRGTDVMEEYADDAYATNEAWKLVDDMRKQLNALHGLAEKLGCALWSTQSVTGEPIRTAHCTATPKPHISAHIPKQSEDPEGYAKLMQFLGVPDELWSRPSGAETMRMHWPGMVEYLTERAEQGLPLPPGIDPQAQRTTFSLTIRARRPVDE